MVPVIPNLYFLIGWKCSRRPFNPYTAPSGTITLVPDGAQVPCCADREVFLLLAALAHDVPWAGQPVAVDARDMRRWLDSGRRLDNSIKHLRRVMSCKFIVPVSGEMHARITIGTMRQTAEHRFLIFFSPEFLAECSHGVPTRWRQPHACAGTRPSSICTSRCSDSCMTSTGTTSSHMSSQRTLASHSPSDSATLAERYSGGSPPCAECFPESMPAWPRAVRTS